MTYHYQYETAAKKDYSYKPRLEKPSIMGVQNTRRRKMILASFYLRMSLCLSVVFLSSVCFLNNHIVVSKKQGEMVRLTNELRKIRSDIAFSEAKLSKTLNPSTIEKIAHEQLGMSKPLPHQVEYILFNK